jgi:hypothetical protein
MTEDYFAGFSPEQRASLFRIFEIQEENFRITDRRAKERILRAAILLTHHLSELRASLTSLQGLLAAKKILSMTELAAFRKELEAFAQVEAALNPELLAQVEETQRELDMWAEGRVKKLLEEPPQP